MESMMQVLSKLQSEVSRGPLTGLVRMAMKVLTTNEQPSQSTELVVVMVESKTVLVPFNGASKTGCRVVHVDCADAWNATRRNGQRNVMKAIAMR